jgi:hypothetical protein
VEGQFRFKAPAGARQIALAELARTGAADLAPAAAK